MMLSWRVFLSLLMLGVAVELRAVKSSPNYRVGEVVQPDCPPTCGDMPIPYPFGLWENCSLPGFKISCDNYTGVGLLPQINAEHLLSISLPQAQARVLIKPSYICESYASGSNWFVDFTGRPFTFSTTFNSFIAIGCDTVALFQGNGGDNYTVGCVSSCGAGGMNKVDDEKCSGIGCCKASIPSGLKNYDTRLRHLDVIKGNINSSSSPKGEGLCGFAFIVETGNYSFKKSDLQRSSNSRDWILQAVLDWAIGDQACSQAQSNISSYACKSDHSVCLNSRTGFGYVCNCSEGYHGNPYLPGGCQDIDECANPMANPCYRGQGQAFVPRYRNRTCYNYPGGYNCTCDEGYTQIEDVCAPNNPPSASDTKRITVGIIIGISCGFGALIFMLTAGLVHRRLIKKRMDMRRWNFFMQNHDILLQQQLLHGQFENIADRIRFFSMRILEKATDNFDRSRVVGDGGHGTVYKGILDLQVVAIKKSKLDIRIEAEQFINEIILLSHMNHRNVVKLIGCCLESEVPLLVYEFISNGTLFHHLHDSRRVTSLSWDDRLRIATEISSALAYMHSAANVSIYHRDIKSLNILLDDKLTAKISDFGASRTIDFDQTHISTNIQGTFGYLDPEYMQTGQLTEKSDVYSLGVILVELLTGEKPSSKTNSVDEGNMISRFIWACKGNQLFQVLESSIIEDTNKEEVEVVAELAMASLSMRGKDRPTIREVELKLEGLRKGKKKMKKHATFTDQFDDRGLSYTASSLQRNGSSITESTSRELSMEGVVPPVKGLVR